MTYGGAAIDPFCSVSNSNNTVPEVLFLGHLPASFDGSLAGSGSHRCSEGLLEQTSWKELDELDPLGLLRLELNQLDSTLMWGLVGGCKVGPTMALSTAPHSLV